MHLYFQTELSQMLANPATSKEDAAICNLLLDSAAHDIGLSTKQPDWNESTGVKQAWFKVHQQEFSDGMAEKRSRKDKAGNIKEKQSVSNGKSNSCRQLFPTVGEEDPDALSVSEDDN